VVIEEVQAGAADSGGRTPFWPDIEGRTIAIEFRWGEGSRERYAPIIAEFLRLKVDGPRQSLHQARGPRHCRMRASVSVRSKRSWPSRTYRCGQGVYSE
jgi:hypothetical protein